MKKLHIIASPRKERSKSKILWDYIFSKLEWEKEILDLNSLEIPFLTEEVIALNYWFWKYEELSEKNKKIVDIQNNFIEQLKNVDEIVVSVPLWNFGMPAILKAYLDLVIKIWETFKSWNAWFEWLLTNISKIYFVWAKWGMYKWQAWESIDMLEPTIKQAFSFIWATNSKEFWLEWVNMLSEDELFTKIEELKKEINNSF